MYDKCPKYRGGTTLFEAVSRDEVGTMALTRWVTEA